jgi:hypothetical protein
LNVLVRFPLHNTPSRIQEMEEIVQIVRQIGQQQAHNAYYRDCYALFKLLQDLTEHTFNEL